jgi:hypothetical protein
MASMAVMVGGLLLGCDNAPATPEPGPRGPQGPAGNTAMEVREFTVRSSDFSLSSDGTIATAVYRVPEITAEVVDGGVVAVHWDIAGDGRTWRPLPWLFQFNDLVVSVIGYVYSAGSIGLQVSSPDAASTAGTVGGIDGNRLQVVVLPPDE